MKAIINGKIYYQQRFINGKIILFDHKIVDIVDTLPQVEDLEIIDVEGEMVLPGFVDVHVHGSHGADVMDGKLEAMETISKGLAKTGVTKYLATTMTMAFPDIYQALDTVRQYMKDNKSIGAKPLGVHLEGPYISETYKGAQNPKHISRPKWSDIEDYKDVIKIITLAVEEDIDYAFIKSNPGIKLSIGHSAASFEEALEAYDLGVCHCTHCFNGMTGLHHRKPGVVGATFTKPFETEFIADGVHIHSGFLDTFVKIIGKEQAILITDSMRAGGMPKGNYDLGGQNVTVDASSARLADGTLAGSILTIDQAIRNMKNFTSYSLEDIIDMATINPARSVEETPNYGVIQKGNAADFVMMNQDLHVIETWVDGQAVYRKDRA